MFSSLGQHNFLAYTASLFRSHRNFGYLHGSLTPTHKFRITPRVSYTHIEILDFSTGFLHLNKISDNSMGLLYPHRNFGFLHGSLTPTHKFWISPRVSYTLTEIWDVSSGLLHPHKNSRYLTGSLTPIQKFRISPRVSYTHTEIWDLSPGLLHPHRNSGYLPGSLTPTQKFRISPRVSYTHTEIQDLSPGLLHPHRTFRILPRVSFTLTPGFSP